MPHVRHRTPLFAALAASLLVLAVGCGSSVQQPTATVRSAKLGSITEDGLSIDFDVNVANPNSFALPVSAANYKLGFAGVNVVDDTAKPSGSVPANGTLPVTVPVALSFKDLLRAERAIVDSGGNVPYQLEGELAFATGPLAALGRSVKVPLNFNGTLPLRDYVRDPVALMKSPAGRQLLQAILGKSPLGELLGR